MATSSYQAPKRGDKDRPATVSQSVSSNLASGDSTVERLMESKSDVVYTVRAEDTIGTAVTLLRDKGATTLMNNPYVVLFRLESEHAVSRGKAYTN